MSGREPVRRAEDAWAGTTGEILNSLSRDNLCVLLLVPGSKLSYVIAQYWE